METPADSLTASQGASSLSTSQRPIAALRNSVHDLQNDSDNEHSLGLARVDKGHSLTIYGRRSDRGLTGRSLGRNTRPGCARFHYSGLLPASRFPQADCSIACQECGLGSWSSKLVEPGFQVCHAIGEIR